ncbi:hypothetical protein [Cecembia calidifontis]|uniref:Uncharacterized protein n=1 Tax=Cecembia calidifontis TaxID=1187080 RepID=A0A4Q7P6I8_9BACT|nr:hypothetical protein [Cecembia calidifontis]RZS95696.1 hypothetical protein BC751_1236 [Cecembia calidifontis]
MVRTLFILCMAWMVILNSMVYSVICVNFQLNRSFIVEMFCENKDLPMSECQGTCYLNKQLDQASQESDSDWMSFRADFNLFIFPETITEIVALIVQPLVSELNWHIVKPYIAEISTLERPPENDF